MPKINDREPIEHDAPLTEIFATDNGVRYRVYRGDTQAHIDWKMHEYRTRKPEMVEYLADIGDDEDLADLGDDDGAGQGFIPPE